MTDTKNTKSLRAILAFFRVLYGLIWVFGGFVLLLCMIMPFTPEVKDEFCLIPVNFTLQEGEVSVMLNGEAHSALLGRTSGALRIQGGPLLLSYVYLLFSLVIMAVILYGLRLAIRILAKFQAGKIFLLENARDLHRIALASLFLFVFLLAVRIGYGLYASGRILSDSLVHTGLLGSSLDLSLADLAVPLFLLVLAGAFRAGVSLQEDQDLTV